MPSEYAKLADIFSSNLIIELSKNISINNYVIKIIESKKLLYNPINNLSLVELEIINVYIETHFKTRFIHFSIFFIGVLIFFNKKSNSSLCLYIDY